MGFRATRLLICSIVLPINLNAKSFNFSHLENRVSNRIHFIKVLRGLTELMHGAGFSTEQTPCYTFFVFPTKFYSLGNQDDCTQVCISIQQTFADRDAARHEIHFLPSRSSQSIWGGRSVNSKRGSGQTRKNEAPPLLHLPPHVSGLLFSKTLKSLPSTCCLQCLPFHSHLNLPHLGFYLLLPLKLFLSSHNISRSNSQFSVLIYSNSQQY